jgi:hypothetical protein
MIFSDLNAATTASSVIDEAITRLRDIQREIRTGADAYIPSSPPEYAQLKAAVLAWADGIDRVVPLMAGWKTDTGKFQRGMALVGKMMTDGKAIIGDFTWGAPQAKLTSFFAWFPQATQDGMKAMLDAAGDVAKTASWNILWPALILGGSALLLIFGARKSGLRANFGPVQLVGLGDHTRRKRRRR